MNVLMIDSEVTWRGGEGQLYLLMKGLADQDVSITLGAAENAAITERAETQNIPCLRLPISGGMDLAAVWKLRGYLRRYAFDIVHCHSSHAHSVAFMAIRSAISSPRPRLVVSRRVDFPVAQNGLSSLKYRYGADVYLAISTGVRDVLIRCGVDEGRITLVRSGIDLNKFAAVKENSYLFKEFGLANTTPVIGNIAALAPHKSQTDFVRAAELVKKQIPGAKFFVVGEGEMRPSLESQIRKLGLAEDVILTGFREDVLELLSTFDCFVLSSYLEGLCTSIMDAQALGIPVVATQTGGIPDLVENGVTGLLAPPRRPDLLADAIVQMMNNAGLRKACVAAAKTQAESYDYGNMVKGTVDVYYRTLEKGVRVS